MKATGNRPARVTSKRATVALLAIALMVMATLLAREFRFQEKGNAAGSAGGATPGERVRNLSEAVQAQFISIIILEADGRTSSAVMAGSTTEEFDSLSEALAEAQPVAGATDDSFNHLLVLSFARGDTLDISYSPARNLIMLGEQAYRPAADLSPLIAEVRQKFNYNSGGT